jgi:molybdopterin/thiamine biosynthesis adenylyltransferase
MVREIRARVLFDYGRRPAFQKAEGVHIDDQELDYGAWHFIARRDPGGPPLGYVRLATPATGELFQTRAFLGTDRYREVLRLQGVGEEETFEHSRLVVEHHARKLGLGLYLNAVAIGAAHSLGAKLMIGTSGTKDGQNLFHERFGFRELADTRRYVSQYTEDVVIMVHRVGDGAGEYADLVTEMRDAFPALAAAGLAAGSRPPGTAATPQRPAATISGPAPAMVIDSAHHADWRPVLFDRARAAEREACEALLASGKVREVCDTVDDQLVDLIRCREPGARYDRTQVAVRKARQLAGRAPCDYGTWAWYPWSARFVHVLPCEEFRLVRTDRNRGKIERPAQRRLLGCRIGVIGHSAGSASARTLAMEGIGGAFKLADASRISLPDLNRLDAGTQDLGANKAVMTGRKLSEIDPYLDVEVVTGELSGAAIGEFLAGIDLLVEECDDLYLKVACREQARALGIPVVSPYGDRGMLDIERFDLQPARPLLHGLLGGISSATAQPLTHPEKADLILRLLDEKHLSPELRASLGRVGEELSGWPQLGSEAALGAAITAEAARRILLGDYCPSGRFYADVAGLITVGSDSLLQGSPQ